MLALTLPLRDPVAVFALVLLVLLAAPLLERRRVPSAVALLVAGVALGPHGLGVLARDDTMVLLGTVGLLYIMFLAGLEIDLGEFWRHRRRSLGFGLATFALPLTVGTAVGRLAFGFGWPAAVLLGSVFASHTLLAYPAARRLGLARSNAVTTAVGATILTDTLALLILAVIAGVAEGEAGPLFLAELLALLAGLTALVWWGLPRLGARAFRTFGAEGTAEFVFVLAAVFTTALAAELIGVEPIIGAFLAGLALNRLVPESSPLMNRIGFVGNALFIPFFLLSTGMLVDLGVFADGGRAWLVAGVMVATILGTKGGAALLTRPLFRFSRAEAGVAFGLTVPQAAATLAAVLIGYELGLFDAAVLNGTIAMVLVTCLVGPWVTERAGRRLAVEEAARDPRQAAPRQRILVPLANPQTVERIMDVALLVRDARSTEPLYPLTVVPSGAEQAAHVARGERLLSRAVAYAAGADVPTTPLVRVDFNVARGLARAVAETQSSTVVMGWDGSASAQRLLFGSIPDRLLHESPAMLLIAKGDRPAGTVGRVLLAAPPLADHEPGFPDALRAVKQLAHHVGAPLVLLTPAPYRTAARRALERARPAVPLQEAPLEAWKALLPALDAELRSDDALVLLSARQGSMSWRASLDRLPRLLAHRFPALPLLVVYPAQVPISALLPAALSIGERAFLDGLGPDRIALDLQPGPVEAVLRQLLSGLDRRRRDEAARALVQAAPDSVPELAPGLVLYHAHTDAVEQVALFVGVSGAGVRVPHASGPVHVVLALALPAVLPPKHSLELLALTARLVQPAGTVDALRACTTAAEVRATLLRALHAPEPPAEHDAVASSA